MPIQHSAVKRDVRRPISNRSRRRRIRLLSITAVIVPPDKNRPPPAGLRSGSSLAAIPGTCVPLFQSAAGWWLLCTFGSCCSRSPSAACRRRCAAIDLSTRTVLSVGRPRLRGRATRPRARLLIRSVLQSYVAWRGRAGEQTDFTLQTASNSHVRQRRYTPSVSKTALWSHVVADKSRQNPLQTTARQHLIWAQDFLFFFASLSSFLSTSDWSFNVSCRTATDSSSWIKP